MRRVVAINEHRHFADYAEPAALFNEDDFRPRFRLIDWLVAMGFISAWVIGFILLGLFGYGVLYFVVLGLKALGVQLAALPKAW